MLCQNHVDVSEGVRRCARCGTPFCSDCLVEISGRPYCANCKTEQLLDVRSGVDRTKLNFASPWKRFGAMFIDNLLMAIPIYGIMFGLIFLMASNATPGAEPNPAIFLLIYIPIFGIPVLYEGLMLQLKDGQTLGKMALKVKVVRPDGSSISSGQAWGRSVMRIVLSCLSIVDYIPAFFTNEKTTLHDMIAGTRVVEIY
ncbi:MAG: RDD family protein [Thermoanaerobaculia bacterium]